MELRELQQTLETTLAVTRPSAREVRDGLVDYYATLARPFILKGLAFTDPQADEAFVRRMLLSRLSLLWRRLESPWDRPKLDDLRVFRLRIERYACARPDPALARVGELLDQLFLSASVSERLDAARARKSVRRFQVIEGGGQLTEPTGRLHLVRAGERATATMDG